MKGIRLPLAAVLGVALAAGLAQAQPNCGCYYPPIPQAPDMCNPGYYWNSVCGLTYGPVHCVTPPYPPFQGMVPGPPPPRGGPGGAGGPGAAQSPIFPTHPYARSPRDFFMYYDKDEPSYAPGSYFPVSAPAVPPPTYFPAPAAPAVPPAVPPKVEEVPR